VPPPWGCSAHHTPPPTRPAIAPTFLNCPYHLPSSLPACLTLHHTLYYLYPFAPGAFSSAYRLYITARSGKRTPRSPPVAAASHCPGRDMGRLPHAFPPRVQTAFAFSLPGGTLQEALAGRRTRRGGMLGRLTPAPLGRGAAHTFTCAHLTLILGR